MPSLLTQIGLTDILDIGFVTIFLYAAAVWLRKTKAALVGLGIFILAMIYLFAKQFHLQLTAWILQGFFAIFLIMIVVIFQEEFRQVFERIALWGLGRKGAAGVKSETVDVLVETVADLAKDKTGALIILPGTQPIERHISGGIELHGHLSEPLLRSLFDPHSPGHDGAVIIEKNQISRYAVHLPLSNDFRQLSGAGTRHSAALGLAELTDSLCLVVSEERGQISIAREGRLRLINNPQELVSLFREFLTEKQLSGVEKKAPTKFFRENWIEKSVSLFIAVGLWYVFISGSKVSEVSFDIPVHVVNLPSDLALESVEPQAISAVFKAPRRVFYFFDSEKVEVTIDTSLAALGRRTFRISKQNLNYPGELTLKEVRPDKVKISVNKVSSEEPKENTPNNNRTRK